MSRKRTEDPLGKRLKEIRGEMKQVECAKRLGIARSALSHYEQGRENMSVDTLIKISKLFNVSADYILGLTDKK